MNKLMSLAKSNVVKNSIWLYILQFANLILPLLTIPYVTRTLGAAGYGEYSIAYNWMTYFQVIVEYGFALGGARKIANSDSLEEDNKNFREILTARFGLFLISFVSINLICIITGSSRSEYANVMILMLIVLSVVFQANWIFQGKQQMKFITIVNVAGRTLSVLLIFAFVKAPNHVWLYCLFYSITFIFSSAIGLAIAVKRFHLSYRLPQMKGVITAIKDNFSLFASAAISRLFGNVGITILGIYAIEKVVGGYSAVYKIPYIMTLFFSPIGQALYPYISKRYIKDKESANRLLRKIAASIVCCFALAGLIIIIFRKYIVSSFLGDEYKSYSDLILLLIPQMLFGIVNNFLGVQSLVANGKQNVYTVCILIGVLCLVALNFLLCPFIGATGTAIAALSSECILTLTLLICCRKYVWRKQSV